MLVYLVHSTSRDYLNELYKPLLEAESLDDVKFIFPHQQNQTIGFSKPYILKANLVIADVTDAGIGSGIEIGWAESAGIPLIFLAKDNATVSKSLTYLDNKIYRYNTNNLIETVVKLIQDWSEDDSKKTP